MKHRIFTTAGLVSLCLFSATPTLAENEGADTVVATVNGVEITLGHVITARQSLPPQYQNLEDAQLFDGIVNQIVQQELLKQSSGETSGALKYLVENEERVAIAGYTLEKIATESVTDEALQAAYDAKYAEFEPEREFHAAHILVGSEEEAKELLTALEGGADFANLAREKSTGPSGPNGGDLGWFGHGMMVAPFEEAVIALEPEQVSEPVQTQFGWHVIKLMESRLASVPPLEEVKEELAANIQDGAIRSKLQDLETSGSVERIEGIDTSLLRDDSLLND